MKGRTKHFKMELFLSQVCFFLSQGNTIFPFSCKIPQERQDKQDMMVWHQKQRKTYLYLTDNFVNT